MGFEKLIIIIGAPRSGTNMLRDCLARLPRVETWPCDELNWLWKHGNTMYPNDAFPEELARNDVKKFLRNEVGKAFKRFRAEFLVEKTCANSLRVSFVHSIFPEAKIVFIVRDGIDASVSASKRWTGDIKFSYIAKKLRYVPIVDMPLYVALGLKRIFTRFCLGEGTLPVWGPVFADHSEVRRACSTLEVSAIQWKRCVETSETDLESIPKHKVMRLRYEDFVGCPEKELERLVAFLGVSVSNDELVDASSIVSDASVGKGSASLCPEELANLEDLLGDTLVRYRYNDASG